LGGHCCEITLLTADLTPGPADFAPFWRASHTDLAGQGLGFSHQPTEEPMSTIAVEATAPRRPQGIVTLIVRGLAARFARKGEAAELRRLAALPPYLVADMGLPGFHLMPPKARKAAYRAALRQNG
jgi:hypothetical protein